jgi:HAD superfamily hydrolase (TIGR01509 family)
MASNDRSQVVKSFSEKCDAMILFDLDDTIFDHKHSRLCGLIALQNLIPQLKSVALETLESEHDKHLLANYGATLSGQVSVADARVERIKNLLTTFGVNVSKLLLQQADDIYRSVYHENRRPVPGVSQLLNLLRDDLPLGLVTNGLSDIQHEKIDLCNVRHLLDFIFISEEIGYRKPEKAFFEHVFSQTGSSPNKTVLVGDLWDSDIMGGYGAGMRTVWLNRYERQCPDPSITTEIHGYEPTDNALKLFRTVIKGNAEPSELENQ